MTIREVAERLMAQGFSAPREARDPVNQPMINNWAEAMGDAHPLYQKGIAPPAMVQVWTMRGLRPRSESDDPLQVMSAVLDEAGYTSVVATNCEQTYHRYLREGEVLTVRSRLSDLSGPKRTTLGEGWFVTTESVWYSGEEAVAWMLFRVLKYKPAPMVDAIRPAVSRDTEYFWAGTAVGELRIQSCAECGRFRHPPGPMCPSCGSLERSYVVAEGTGIVFSYVVHHHPPVPGKALPFIVALVELAEGVRMVGSYEGDRIEIGQPVKVAFFKVDDELTLPGWVAA